MDNPQDQETNALKLMHARLELFYREQGYHRSNFASAVGEQMGKLVRGLEGHSGSAEFLTRANELFPALNLRWLLTGKGNMYRAEIDENNQALSVRHRRLDQRVREITAMPTEPATVAAHMVDEAVQIIGELMAQRMLLDAVMQDAQLATLEAYKAAEDARS